MPVPTAAVCCAATRIRDRWRRALAARGAPVEVVGLAGLLSVGEVADVVAMLRLVADPMAGAPPPRSGC